MFVNKEKINTSRFCFLSCIMRNLQKKPQFNMATALILDKPLSFCLTPLHPFSNNSFQTPIPYFHQSEKVNSPSSLYEGWGRGSVQTMNRLLNYGVTMDLHKESFIQTGESCLH